MKKWNHYTCEKCGKVTVARHDDEGVTPFIINCHASDEVTASNTRIQTCRGAAQSCMFDCDQSDDQKPHVIFYRPEKAEDAVAEIAKEKNDATKVWLFEHYMKGGALMKFPEAQP